MPFFLKLVEYLLANSAGGVYILEGKGRKWLPGACHDTISS